MSASELGQVKLELTGIGKSCVRDKRPQRASRARRGRAHERE